MNVYELGADVSRYQHLTLFNMKDVVRLDQFDGTPTALAATWQPLLVEVLRDAHHRNRPRSDFPSFGGVPVFSERAIEALRDLLEPRGEILPLRCHEGTYLAYNVTRSLDALDEAHSELERFPSSGRVMRIERPEFFPEKLAGEVIFRVPQSRVRIFVTDPFAQRIKEQCLVGFDLTPVWSGPDGASRRQHGTPARPRPSW